MSGESEGGWRVYDSSLSLCLGNQKGDGECMIPRYHYVWGIRRGMESV